MQVEDLAGREASGKDPGINEKLLNFCEKTSDGAQKKTQDIVVVKKNTPAVFFCFQT